ncbi:MAG: hypothetical protein ABUS49_08260 [Acidobacteriota bacterium]
MLGRAPREPVTPLIQRKVVWAGTTLGSYEQGADALEELAGIKLAPKQVQRITSQAGADRVKERRQQVGAHHRLPLMTRVAAPPGVTPPDLAVVMMDGGRYQRRDDFRERKAVVAGTPPADAVPTQPSSQDRSCRKTHWHEDKLGLVLSMKSDVHEQDPCPEFPEWLASAPVIAELAKLAERDENSADIAAADPETSGAPSGSEPSADWPDLAPQLLAREVIASSEAAEAFGQQLEHKAWETGAYGAARQAFVADGLAVNWTIHRKHFSQMTGILDLMHGLSYAWRAAGALDDQNAYHRYATWIWQGQVQRVIDELRQHQQRIGPPDKAAGAATPCHRIHGSLTYYQNHQQLMNYPAYRRDGLPLTSSHVESTMKQINTRVKGTEKFWCADNSEAILQLRADTLSDSKPLDAFWNRWQQRQSGANRYRTLAT